MVASSTSSPDAMIPFTFCPSAVPELTASRSISPVEIAGTPSWLASRVAWVPLPAPGGPSRTILGRPLRAIPKLVAGSLSAPPTTDATLFHEPFVVAHHELAFDLLDRIHRHADHDEERGAAEVELDPQTLGEPIWEVGSERAPDHRQAGHVEAG